ncbi:MAG: BREX-2 system adenine-specific DNA-methyltransferase PglX [Rhodopirellula sp.]|nr:BREX-2 system adenine-specific DNA-methyltransferase PglX [Rhodopirellula sp.]
MIDRIALLSDLQSLLKRLEADLLERSDSDDVPEVRQWLRAEYDKAKKSERTAQTLQQWVDDFITQVAAAWVLSAVFARFLEDNGLVDPPRISGPQDVDNPASSRLSRARDEHEVYFSQHPKHSNRDYFLDVFAGLAKLPATADVFGEHNPLNALPNWLGPDAAGEVLTFFQKIDAGTGQLVHDFSDPDWNTRFLGDLYQDLSEAARKKYALLQTPEFVEEFILDRTLDPALDEFGLAGFKMIDPACGSGHFLLGSFPRILDRWNREEPGTNIRELVQRTLSSIHGVDINPFAIAIARFRLLLAALRTCEVTRLLDSPQFKMNLACGDSLLHAPVRMSATEGQQVFEWELTGGDSDCEHAYQSEDLPSLKRMLRPRMYHAVVANPPYIVPNDAELNQRYRNRFRSCHKQYSLAAPFMEQIYRVATRGGYTGQITANSFMNNEFGSKLVEEFLPRVDLTAVVDTRFLQPPGHATPTVILFGRARSPVRSDVRLVMGIKGESPSPSNLAAGRVWTAILNWTDCPGAEDEYISVVDMSRDSLATHPWSIGGGGAAELKTQMGNSTTQRLGPLTTAIGRTTHTGEDPAFVIENCADRTHGWSRYTVPIVTGEDVRDFAIQPMAVVIFPYDQTSAVKLPLLPVPLSRHFWNHRVTLKARRDFGQTIEERGLDWTDHSMFFPARFRARRSIVFAFKATHNHFVLDRGGKVFNRPAPAIILPADSHEDELMGLFAVLNSSLTALWEREVHRQVSGAGEERWEVRLERNATKYKEFPLPDVRPVEFGRLLDELSQERQRQFPARIFRSTIPTREMLATSQTVMVATIDRMVAVQEELDWECYRLYGLIDGNFALSEPPPLKLGERAFEIVLARKLVAGGVQTTWFERHGSTPITELPDHWPDDYKRLVERRIEVIETNPQIALVEQPEYKRRWNTEPWDSQVERALKSWLLDRLESYFDFDGRMRELQGANCGSGAEQSPAASVLPLADIQLVSVTKLADVAAKDAQFMEVAEVYRDDPAFHVQRLVEELVAGEHVPLLPVLRYNATGLRKREQWEETWELQREEDELERQRTELREAMKRREEELGQQFTQELAAIANVRKSLLAACHCLKEVLPDSPEIDDSRNAEDVATQLLAMKIEGKHIATATAVHNGQETVLKAKRDLARAVRKAAATDEKHQNLVTQLEAVPENPEIAVPPKYASTDFISTGGARYWSLRGKLDVPKERWISFPHCHAEDGSLMICWAGYDHLQQTTAISAWYMDVRDRQGGKEDPRLIPLLACLVELLPWLKQWHNEIDPTYGMAMSDYFAGFVQEEARSLNLTPADIKAWTPPKTTKKKATRKKATRKKTAKKQASEAEE